MSYIEKSISIFGTEIEFLQAFINAITAADSRITCTTNNLAAQFADDSNKPTFTLSVDEIYTITFTRDYLTNDTGSGYRITSPIFNSNKVSRFQPEHTYPDYKRTRTWKFAVVTNDENIYLKFTGFDDENTEKFLSVRNSGISAYAAAANPTDIMSTNFVSTGGQIYRVINRLPYAYNAADLTKLEVIKSKTFVENETTNRAFETSKIIDSTTVIANQIISIDSTKYYAIDSNTLMEIE